MKNKTKQKLAYNNVDEVVSGANNNKGTTNWDIAPKIIKIQIFQILKFEMKK